MWRPLGAGRRLVLSAFRKRDRSFHWLQGTVLEPRAGPRARGPALCVHVLGASLSTILLALPVLLLVGPVPNTNSRKEKEPARERRQTDRALLPSPLPLPGDKKRARQGEHFQVRHCREGERSGQQWTVAEGRWWKLLPALLRCLPLGSLARGNSLSRGSVVRLPWRTPPHRAQSKGSRQSS